MKLQGENYPIFNFVQTALTSPVAVDAHSRMGLTHFAKGSLAPAWQVAQPAQ